MRVLLSTVGSRGDVQPMVALASHLREAGHDACLCAPPGFEESDERPRDSITSPSGTTCGSDLARSKAVQRRQSPRQFAVLREAAADCAVIVGCAAMQIATRSIAEMADIPYFYTAYSPVALPSEHHSPPPVHGPPRPQGISARAQWDLDAQWWNEIWGEGLNAARAGAGLGPVADVRAHVITDRPLLAADPTLAPWPTPSDLAVIQTGSWLASRPAAAGRRTESASSTPAIHRSCSGSAACPCRRQQERRWSTRPERSDDARSSCAAGRASPRPTIPRTA